jgi:hypothetical protein
MAADDAEALPLSFGVEQEQGVPAQRKRLRALVADDSSDATGPGGSSSRAGRAQASRDAREIDWEAAAPVQAPSDDDENSGDEGGADGPFRPLRTRTAYIQSVPAAVTEQLLLELFTHVGPVERVSITSSGGPVFDGPSQPPPSSSSSSSSSHRYAHVDFLHEASVPYACRVLSGVRLFGVPLSVIPSGSRERRTAAFGHVLVRGLHPRVDGDALADALGACGEVLEAHVVRDAMGSSKGYGFVVFESVAEAITAVQVVGATSGAGGPPSGGAVALLGVPLSASLANRTREALDAAAAAAAAAVAGAPSGPGAAASSSSSSSSSRALPPPSLLSAPEQPVFLLQRRPAALGPPREPSGDGAAAATSSPSAATAASAPCRAVEEADAFAATMSELPVGPDLMLALRREAVVAACAQVSAQLLAEAEEEGRLAREAGAASARGGAASSTAREGADEEVGEDDGRLPY